MTTYKPKDNSITSLKSEDIPHGTTILNLLHFKELTFLPENLPGKITEINLFGCEKLKFLPKNLPANLENLSLGYCAELAFLPENLPGKITVLNILGCEKLKFLPKNLPANLENLSLSVCTNLKELPDLPAGIISLNLRSCKNLTSLPELPSNLVKLILERCKSLTSLPPLPSSITKLDLSGCTNLPNDPAIVTQLMELEEANRDNPNFILHWPEHFDRSSIKTNQILTEAYKTYYESNPDLKDLNLEPNPSDRANFPTFALFHRFMNESTAQRGGVNQIARSIFPTIEAIRKNPQILEFIDESSKAYLDACVNQPVAGVTEIANLVKITTKTDIPSKLEAAKTLMAINLIKEEVTKLVVGQGVEAELANAMLREVHRKLLSDGKITEAWPGIPEGIAYETTIRNFLTPNNIDKISTEVSDFLKDTSKEKVADYLCEGPLQNFWATQTLSKEEINNLEQPLKQLKGQFLNLEDQTEEVEEAAIILEKIRLAETEYKKSILIESRNKTFDAIRRPGVELSQSSARNVLGTGISNEVDNIPEANKKCCIIS